MVRSDLCDYSDAYIVIKGTVTVADPNNNAYNKKLAFKNNAPFISCILKINNTLSDNPGDRHCDSYVQLDWGQQMLYKNNKNFVELLQRWTKQWCRKKYKLFY